uniref:Uncharacterized protein n=1 Tax=Meloidogyne javanica TaxID=6303 RepID=A0A915LUM7_MELJA
MFIQLLFIILSLILNSYGSFEGESASFDISPFLEEASPSEPKSLNQKKNIVGKHRQNFLNKKYLPLYKEDKIWSPTENDFGGCPKGEQEFEIGEIVEVKNWDKLTGGTEWLLAKIVKIENGGYEAQVINSPLFGAQFFRCSKDIRKYSSTNDTFQINEIVEVKNRKEWILGKITGKEAGKYIISVLSGHRYGMIFRRYSEELRKYDILKDLKHYEIGEIIEVKNFDQQTKETNWIKAKILEINQGNNYSLEVVEKCKLKGVVFNRNIYRMRKFKIENFQVGEQVEVCIYDKINDKTEWVKAIILEKRNGNYILGTGIYILEEYPLKEINV